jgi:BioD-like phosphotransacetylase family protein
VDASNADIASLLNAKIVLVANGGLGNTFDELELNRNMCQRKNVDIAGVIINKVNPQKYEQTKEYLMKTFQQKWKSNDGTTIPMLGCIPDRPFLGCPALADLERLFNATVISGSQHRLRHYRIQDLMLVATSLNVFLQTLRQNRLEKKRTLYVCHASRNDILLGYLMESVQRNRQQQQLKQQQYNGHSSTTTTISINGSDNSSSSSNNNESFETAMIVTGCAEHPISTQVLEIVMNLPNTAPPVLMTEQRTDIVMQGIYQYTPKLNNEDSNRVERAVQHYQPYIDFDLLLERVAIKK